MTPIKQYLILSLLLSFAAFTTQAQTYNMAYRSSLEITSCNATIYDNGGSAGNYSNSSYDTLIIKPGISGKKVRLSFNTFNLESCCDHLVVYNGIGTNEQIGNYSGFPPTLYSSDSSGALTVLFYTDGSGNRSGFSAEASCVDSVPVADGKLSNSSLNTNTIIAGNSIRFYLRAENTGATNLVNTPITYYLSTDSILDASDDSLAYSMVYLNSGASSNYSGYITIPTSVTEGDYFLLAFIDTTHNSNKTDNLVFEPIEIQEAKIDLQVISASLSSDALKGGDVNTFSYMVKNEGNTYSDYTYNGFYLSTDMEIDTNDILLTTDYMSRLGAEASNSYSHSASIPNYDTLKDGVYYLILLIDHDSINSEQDESNNTHVSQVFYTKTKGLSTTTDINVTLDSAVVSSNSISKGDFLMVKLYTSLQGTNKIGTSYTDFILSDDANYDPETDSIIGSYYTSYLYGTGYTTVYVSIPVDSGNYFSAEDYYLFLHIDAPNHYSESDEDDNMAFTKIKMKAPSYDLQFTSTNILQDSILKGDYIQLSSQVLNTGSATPPTVKVSYYLSDDNQFDAGDSLFQFASLNYLYPGREHYSNASLSTNNLQPGEYYLLTVLDASNTIAESDETNNIQANKFTVFEITNDSLDLVLKSVQLPDSLSKGVSITVKSTSYLYQTNNLNNLTISYYLSADSTFDISDLSNELSVESLNLNPYRDYHTTDYITIPNDTKPGKAYIVVKVDAYNTLFEDNETNNVYIAPVYIRPNAINLSLNELSPDQVILENGATARGTYFVYNSGKKPCDTAFVKAYITNSPDAEINASTPVIWSDTIFNPTNYSNSDYFSIELPDTLTYDSIYTITFSVQVKASEEEDYIGDNTSQFAVIIHPTDIDIELSNLSLIPEFATVSSGLVAYTKLINNGTTAAPPSNINFYLSTDNTFSNEDVLCKTSTISNMGIGFTNNVHAFIPIDASITPGAYYILAVADPENTTPESDETNNILSQALDIYASGVDIAITELSTELDTVAKGGSIRLGLKATNNGNEYMYGSYMGIYLSIDSVFSTNDLLISSKYISSLSAGTSDHYNYQFLLSNNVDTGNYYLITVADMNNDQVEIKEDNNTTFVPLRIREPKIDLEFTSTSLGDTLYAYPGGETPVTVTITNNELDYLNYQYAVGRYLSTDSIFSPLEDAFLGKSNMYYTNSIQTLTMNLLVPQSAQNGNYYTLLVADNTNVFSETNEDNNVLAIPTTITDPNIDLVSDNLYFSSDTVRVGGSVSIYGNIVNKGRTSSTNNNSLSFYISNDTLWSESDEYLGSTHVYNLQGNSSLPFGRSLYLNSNNNPPDSYYIVVVADADNYLEETNETNNISYLPITIAASSVDLVIETPYVEYYAGNSALQLNISCKVRNVGNDYASSSTLGYYLSSDTLYDNNDYYLGTDYVTSLSAGYHSSESMNTTLYETAGSRYLLLVADLYNTVTESNEGNNVHAYPLDIEIPEYDVSVSNLIVHDTIIKADQYFDFSYSVENLSEITAKNIQISHYISTDTVLNSYYHIGAISVDSLEASEKEVMRPSAYTGNIPPGNYYLTVRAAYYDTINELDASNNITFTPITIQASDIDLEIIQSKVLVNSDSLRIDFLMANNGTDNFNDWGICNVYLSEDSIYDGSDYLLDSAFFSPINGGSNLPVHFSNNYLPSFDWNFVILVTDPLQYIHETNEHNNIFVQHKGVEVSSIIDFEVSDAVLKLNADTIHLNYTTINNGPDNFVSSVKQQIYLSADSVLGSSDVLMVETNTPFDVAYVPVQKHLAVIDPQNINWKYIIISTDPNNQLVEIEEQNNLYKIHRSEAVPLQIDYQIASATAALEDSILSVEFSLVNNGVDNAYNNMHTKVYLSTDSVWSVADSLIDEFAVTCLVGNSFSFASQWLAERSNWMYVIVRTDTYDEVTESNETNNTRCIPITFVSMGSYDYTIAKGDIKNQSNEILGYVTIENKGTDTFNSLCYSQVVLSMDTIIDNGDTYLDDVITSPLNPGSSKKIYFNIDQTKSTSNWEYILVYLNYNSIQYESDKTNNLVVFQKNEALGINPISLSKGDLILYPVPANEYVNVKTELPLNGYCIYDASGKMVTKDALNQMTNQIETHDLQPGIYIILFTDGTSNYATKFEIKR